MNLTQARGATAILVLGALAVAAGVAMGAIATSAREPGRPTIDVKRLDDKTILIEVQGDGLPSYDWYEASATGYTDSSHTSPAVDLVSARFSPGQDGKLDWKQRVDAQSPDGKVKVGWVLVRVRHNLASTNPTDISCVEKDATCLAIAVPVTPEAAGR